MKRTASVQSQFLSKYRVYRIRFADDQSGGIIPFILVLFLLMFVASGMAVDFMRHEMARADLQNALDRGVLAAADVNQSLGGTTEESKSLIEDYMKSRSYKAPYLKLQVATPTISGGRQVSASAEYQLDTFFLGLIGIDTLSVPASTQAQQAASNVEISLILDVSGSMEEQSTYTSGGTRLTDLQSAAKSFIDTVLTDENKDRTAISIIPYSAQVNLSDSMAAAYNIDRHHDYGNCVDFSPNDYLSTDISTTISLPQTQHFADFNGSYNYWTTVLTGYRWVRTRWGWRQRPVYQNVRRTVYYPSNFVCPGSDNEILAYSNNAQALKDKIDALDYEGWTAAYTGMKWGVAMLDPSARNAVTSMISSGDVDSSFSGWPADWNDMRTRKILVLMTDGRNTRQYRVNDTGYATQSPDYWNENVIPSQWMELPIDNENDGKGDDYLSDICGAAKVYANTIVYTIGFELASSPEAAAALLDCASSPSTHYMVEGVNIDLAFSNIAAQLENLRLTQ